MIFKSSKSSDNITNKSGFKNAINAINKGISSQLEGKQLPLIKKVYDTLENWMNKQNAEIAAQHQQSLQETINVVDDQKSQDDRTS